jgi:hypothetical protein
MGMVRATGLEPAVCPVKDSVLGTVTSTQFRHARDKCHKGSGITAPRRVRGGPLIYNTPDLLLRIPA